MIRAESHATATVHVSLVFIVLDHRPRVHTHAPWDALLSIAPAPFAPTTLAMSWRGHPACVGKRPPRLSRSTRPHHPLHEPQDFVTHAHHSRTSVTPHRVLPLLFLLTCNFVVARVPRRRATWTPCPCTCTGTAPQRLLRFDP